MAKRDVTVEIKVKDGEVKDAEKSLNRLNKAANDVGKSGTADLKELETGAADAASGLRYLGAAAGPASVALLGIAAAVGTVLAGAVLLGQQIFSLAKDFADYAKAVGDSSVQTGLSVETISALTRQVERTGGSFGDVEGIIKNFTKTMTAAGDGSKKAAADLSRYGIDPAIGLDAAFSKALTTIHDLPPGIDKVRAAMKLFGTDEGYKMIAFVESFNGNLPALMEHFEKLGLVISGEDVTAAAEFNTAYRDVEDQIKGISHTLGSTLLPIVNEVFSDFSQWLVRNGSDIRSWAETVADSVGWVVTSLQTAAIQIRQALDFAGAIPGMLQGSPASLIGLLARNPSDEIQNLFAPRGRIGARVTGGLGGFAPGGGGGGGGRRGGGGGARKLSPIEELEKRRNEAQSALDLVSGSQLAQQLVVETAKINDQKSKLEELLKLRDRLGANQGFALPKTAEETIAEIDALKDNEKGLETAKQMLKGFSDELAGIGKEQTNLEKVNNLLKDPTRNVFIDDTTAALLRTKAALLDAEKAADIYTAALQEIYDTEQGKQLTIDTDIEAIQEEIRLGRDLTALERTRIENKAELIRKEIEWQLLIKDPTERDLLRETLIGEQKITAEKLKQLETETKFRDARRDAESFRQSLEDQFDEVRRGNRPMTVYEETLRKIARGTHEWTLAEQKNNLALAAQIDAVIELNKRHAELKDFFAESLEYVFEGDFRGLAESFTRRIKDNFIDKLSDIFATSVLGFDPNATDNPVAKPIVDKIEKTNQLLSILVGKAGGNPVGGFAGLGSGLNFPGLSGGFGSGGGFGGTPAWGGGSGLGGGGGGFGGFRIPGDMTGTLDAGGNVMVDGRSIIQKITGPGGLFGKEGFGNNVGTYGAIGAIGGLVGSAVGGRFGSAISGAGTGLAIGAQIGSMIMPGIGTAIGAAIGAVGGFLAGLFGFSDPKRKKDKQENIPNLQSGFTQAMKELNEILTDVRFLRVDPDEALKRAMEVRSEISSGFGIKFESSKYQKIARDQIKAKLAEIDREPDGLLAQIKSAAEIARGAADRSKRILPEFAGGVYMSDFFRPNGLLPGTFDGKDNILAMISRGEMVLNPMQQNRVRALAGADVFAGAGIPNYPRASSTPKMAIGGIAGAGLQLVSQQQPTVLVQPNFTLYAEGMTWDARSKVWLESDGGKRTLVKVIKQEKKADKSL